MAHMGILIFTAFFVKIEYRSEAAVYIQYSGYIWTLIGVLAILLSFKGKDPNIDMLGVFFYGSGLAVGTSIIGWSIGKLLEDRSQVHYVNSAQAAADDFARTLLRLKVDLEVAGDSLTEAMKGSVITITKIKDESYEAGKILEELSKNLKKSAVSLVDSLENAKTSFDDLVPTAKNFHDSIAEDLGKLEASVAKLAGLGDHTKIVTKNISDLAGAIKESADTVKEATNQSQAVINQVGRFIDTVFNTKVK